MNRIQTEQIPVTEARVGDRLEDEDGQFRSVTAITNGIYRNHLTIHSALGGTQVSRSADVFRRITP